MTVSPTAVVFWGAFFLLITLCNLLHFHGIRGIVASGVGAEAFVLLSRPWWNRGLRPVKRSKESFRDPAFGSRSERRAAKARAAKRRPK
jgi:hypothetical protein